MTFQKRHGSLLTVGYQTHSKVQSAAQNHCHSKNNKEQQCKMQDVICFFGLQLLFLVCKSKLFLSFPVITVNQQMFQGQGFSLLLFYWSGTL